MKHFLISEFISFTTAEIKCFCSELNTKRVIQTDKFKLCQINGAAVLSYLLARLSGRWQWVLPSYMEIRWYNNFLCLLILCALKPMTSNAHWHQLRFLAPSPQPWLHISWKKKNCCSWTDANRQQIIVCFQLMPTFRQSRNNSFGVIILSKLVQKYEHVPIFGLNRSYFAISKSSHIKKYVSSPNRPAYVYGIIMSEVNCIARLLK